MKTRPTRISRTTARRRRSFAFHPLSFAICLGFSAAALAVPQGGTVVAGQATITKPTSNTQVINQSTSKAIIDWKSFSIAEGEKVRFNQPSSSSVTLNRVTGYDPSYILGEMSSNGKIFLVNPYGVVFGANARVDVGGMVASTLSIANNDFMASRYSLTSVDPAAPAQRGEVRNEGTISAPGGAVVLAGPSVSNTGTIVANGGRVGMIAANAVSIDVEGDGLLFFQISGTEAKNRLEQLGRIQADGGTVEMRAAARGAFADTVLNMAGIVQAKTIGTRGGQIVVDGGGEGIVAVSGRLDATGLAAGERGGSVTVQGQRVLLDNGSVVDASGSAGGGAIRIGGDFHGANPEIRNAEVTGVTSGAVIRADAVDAGDGGTVAIWADGTTRFYGTISAQGGKNGGDGGFVEVSGKQNLDFQGNVSTLAPKGKNGTLLLDPTDIVIAAAPSSLDDTQLDANVPTVGDAAGLILSTDAPVGTATISTTKLEAIAATNSINLNAVNSITINALSSNVTTPNTLTLNTAGGSAQFHSGAGGFTMQAGNTISVTNGSLLIDSGAGPISVGTLQASAGVTLTGSAVTLNAPISVTAAGAGVSITGATTLVGTGGTITLTGSNAANDVTLGTVNGAGRTLNITAGGGDIVLGTVGGGAPLANVTLSGNTASLGAVTTTGAQNYSGVASTTLGGTLTVNTLGAGVIAGATTLGAAGGTITLTGSNPANDVTLGTVTGARPLVITAAGGDVILGAATGLTSATITANTADLQAVTTSGAQNYSGVTTTTLHGTLTVSAAGAGVSAGTTNLAAGGGTIALTGSNAANDVTLGAVEGPSTLDVTATGGDVVLGTVGAGVALSGVSIAANTAALQNVTTNGNQTYNAVVSAAAVTLDAGTGSITANNPNNNFTGALTLKSTGTGVSVHDLNNLQLAAPTLGANTGLTAIAGGTLTLPNAAISTGTGSIDLESNGGTLSTANTLTTASGSITMVGSAGLTVADDLTTGSGPVSLTGSGAGGLAITRDITTTSGAISLTGSAAGGLTVANNRNIDAGNSTITANGGGGTVDFNTSTLTTTNATATAITIRNGAVTLGNISATSGGVVIGVAQDVTGTLGQTNATSIAADTLSVSAAGAIDLSKANAINNLGAVTRGGAFTLNDVGGGLTLTGSVGDAANTAVSITTTVGPLTLGGNSITATGATGNVTLTGVGVSQTAGSTITAGGVTTVNAGTGAIDLQSTTNNFIGNVDLTATGSAAIRDANALVLNSFSGNGITAIAGTTLTLPGGAITTTGGPINLQALGGALSTGGNLTSNGGAITLVGATGLTVGNDLSSAGGAISLTGGGATGVVVTTTHNVDAGAGTITVDGGAITSPIALNSSTLTTSNNGAGAVTIRDAAAVTLGNISATSGTVQIGVGGDVAGAVTQTGGTTLAAATLAASTANSINLGSAGTLTITNLGDVRRGGALTLVDSGGGLTLTGDITTGTTTNAVSITTSTGALTLGTHGISATGGTGNLTLNGVGVTQTSGTLIAGGTTAVNAGTGSVDLQSNSNDFASAAGSVALTGTGPLVAIRDNNDLGLAAPVMGAGTNLTAIAGGTLNLTAGAITTTGTIDLRSLGGALSTPGNLTASAISLTGSAGLALANNLSATTVSLTTTNAAITQPGGIITATGATTFNTGSGAVTLGQANILNSVGGTGGTVDVTEGSANGVVLAATNATSLTVSTTQAAAPVTQSAPLLVSGATTISTTGSGAVTLADPGNNFGSFGATAGAVSVSDSGAIVLNAITAASLLVDTSAGNGTVTQGAALNVAGATAINAGSGAVTLGAANTLGSFGATGGAVSLTENSAGGIALDNVNAISLTVNTSAANGNVTQTALRTLTVSGATAVNAGTGAVTFLNSGNNLGSFGATGGVVSVADSNALALDAINATSLSVDTSAGNGAVTQNAAAIVSGATVVTSGSGPITLANPGNDFSNLPGNSFTGGAISLRDSNDLTVTVLANGSNQAVSVVAGLGLTLPGGVNTGTADLTLSSGALLSTPGTLIGNNVSLTGSAGITIGNDVSAGGNLSLTTANATVNQTAGRIVAGGTTTVTAGAGAVTLAQPLNDFNSINVVSGSVVNIDDSNALTASANASGALTITSTGALVSGGTLSGTNVALTGNAGISLANNVNATGTLQLTTTNAAINQTAGAITVGGLTTASAGSGDITLNQAGNDFSNAAGISASGGAVRLQDANALFIAGLVNGANKDLSLTAGTTITGLAGNIDTGSADLAITAGAGFTTFGTLRGTNVTLGGGTGGVSIGNDVTALGNLSLNATNAAITQTAGTITAAAGTTTASAGTGSISLALAGNNFGTFSATGNAVTVRDDNGLALGPIATTTLTLDSSAGNGAVTQSGASVVSGATTISAGSGAVTLTNAGNDFATIGISGGAVSVTDLNAVALNAITATSLTINTSAGNGNVTQNAAATVTGATAVNAGSGAVTLNNLANNFGSVGASGGAVVVNDIDALALDATNAASLTVTAGGAVAQNAAAVVSGATSVNAGANAITLGNAGNNFGSVGATGGAVSITDSNALALDAVNAASLTLNTAAGNGNITQNAATTVTGATTVNAGSGAVTLSNAGNNFGSVAAIGGAVSVADVNALTLGAINATGLTVNTTAGNGAVTQSGAAVVSGASTVNAGSGAVSLTNAGNDFASLGVTGGAISVVDANALTLSALSSAPNQAVSVVAGGTLSLPATPIDTGGAALTLTSGGTLSTVGTLRGTSVALTSTGAMTLANDVTALGTLGLTTTNAPILQTTGTILATGTTTVSAGSGDITLAQPSNDFQGNLLLSGGAVSVRDVDSLAVTSLVSGPNRPVSLIAGGSLSLPASPIDTGTADLTLQALGGSLAINGALSGNNVTLTGATGLTLGANITSTGDQIYTTSVQLSGNVALNAGASKIDLQGGANGGGNNLSLTSSNAAADAIHTGAAISNTAQFTVTGNSTLGGNVTTTGNQTYTGPVALETNVTLASGAAKIDLQSSVDAAGNTLALTSSNAAADAIRAAGVISNAAQLTVTGKSTFSSGVVTTGAQLYSDTVTLGNSANFIGSSLGFGNGLVAGSFDLGLRSDTLNLAGAVTGSGNATLSSLTQGATVGVAGGAGTYQISQATLDRFATFATLTVGRADGTGDLTFGNLVLPTNFAALSGSGDVDFTGTVASAAGQARNLAVTTGGVTTFGGAVGGAIGGPAALGNLSVAGASRLNASTTANGTVSLTGPVTVGADTTLSAAAVSLGGSLDVGTHAVTFLSDALSVVGPATGSGAGNVRIATKDAAGSMGVAGAAGTLQVSQSLVDTFAGVPTLTLGRNDGTGTISVGTLTLPTDLGVASGSGNVAFSGTLDSAAGPARDLAVATTGTTSFAGTVGATRALDTLAVSGTSQLGASIVTSGAQTFTGAATLAADSTLTAPSVSFGSTVDGARALTVNAAATNFAGAIGSTVALTSLTTDAAGTTQLGGNVTTSGNQTYNDALQLNANVVMAGSTLNLAGAVNGARTLAVNGSTGVTLGSAIGAGTALTGLSVSGPLQLNAGSVTTSGAQSYAGATTLGAATTLTAPSIAFGNALDGGFALTTQSAGPTSFAGAVGATTALASLTASGGGAVQLAGPSIDTTGAQSYSGALQLNGNSRLAGSALTLTGAVSGATDLTLQTNTLNGATSIAGTGVLTIAPVDPTLAIGVAGGAGALQVSQAVLDGATGFTGHVIGRSDGSGTISSGNLRLRANTTLQTATGDLNLAGSVDGAFALVLNSGGTTRITGPVGAGSALTSLTTDNNAAAADWNGTSGERTTFDTADGTGAARVITGGAQTYNDPVTATVPVAFTGGAITATQATNRFDGVVSANAISLDLRNSTDLRLGSLTLVNGGSLETDGVLHVTGALQLNGGVLTLTSNATPTPIDLSDPEYAGKTLSFGFVPIKEASATIVQDAGGSIGSAAGSMLVLRAPAGGSISLEQPGNALLGQVSAVSGTLGDNDVSRFNSATGALTLGFIRIASSEIHVAGSPPANGDQTLQQAGLEADVIKLTADVLTTGPDGLIRARLPFNNIQGAQTSLPGLTLGMTPTALATGGGFGGPNAANFIQVQVGGSEGGFLTARPKGTSGDTAVIFLGGNASVTPFYDGAGKITEIRIFYNGNAPRTPQEAGALAAVIALIEDARQARFEEAVRTENVRSRLRSGVIAEVGAGRPATVGRESIRLPDTCEIKPKTLQCE